MRKGLARGQSGQRPSRPPQARPRVHARLPPTSSLESCNNNHKSHREPITRSAKKNIETKTLLMHTRALRNPIFQIIKLQTPAFCLKTCFCKRQSCHQSSKMHKAVDFKQNAQWVVNLLKAPTLAHAGGGKNCLKPILRAFAIIFLIYCHSTNQKECDFLPENTDSQHERDWTPSALPTPDI